MYAPVAMAVLEETTPVTGMAAVSGGITSVLGIVGTVITEVTSQPVLCAFLAVSFIGIGVAIFRKLRH